MQKSRLGKYSLKTLDSKKEGQPKIELVGSGTMTIDNERGVPIASDFNVEIIVGDGKDKQIVLPLLENNDRGIRQQACDILKDIGTSAAIPELEAAKSKDNISGDKVDDAINAIRARAAASK